MSQTTQNHEQVRLAILGCGDCGGVHAEQINGTPVAQATPKQHVSLNPIAMAKRVAKTILGRRDPMPVVAESIEPMAEAKVVAAVDIDPERAHAFADRFGIKDVYQNYQAVLDRDDIDAVIICTPPSLHATMAIDAANAGKHVFCEKPLSTNSDDGKRMVQAAEDAGVVLQVGYVLRFSDERGGMRDVIQQGKIGRPVFYRELWNLTAGPPPRWVLDDEIGRGTIWENSHILDFLRYTFGEPTAVHAIGGQYKPEQTTAIDTFGVLMTFAQGDQALFTDSYALRGFGWKNHGHRQNLFQIDVAGPQGSVQYPDINLNQTMVVTRLGNGEPIETTHDWVSDWGANGYREEMAHFVDCVRHGTPSRAPGSEGLRTLELCELIRELAIASSATPASTNSLEQKPEQKPEQKIEPQTEPRSEPHNQAA